MIEESSMKSHAVDQGERTIVIGRRESRRGKLEEREREIGRLGSR